MKVAELLSVLERFPTEAVVLFAADGGISRVGSVSIEFNHDGMPDEVILLPSDDID